MRAFVVLFFIAVAFAALPTPDVDFYSHVVGTIPVLGNMKVIEVFNYASATQFHTHFFSEQQPPLAPLLYDTYTDRVLYNKSSFFMNDTTSICVPFTLVWPPVIMPGSFFLGLSNFPCNMSMPAMSGMCDLYNGTYGPMPCHIFYIHGTNLPLGGYCVNVYQIIMNITYVPTVQAAADLNINPLCLSTHSPSHFTEHSSPPPMHSPSHFTEHSSHPSIPVYPPTNLPCSLHMKLLNLVNTSFGNIVSKEEQWLDNGNYHWNSDFKNPIGLGPSTHNYTVYGRKDLNVTYTNDHLTQTCSKLNFYKPVGIPLNYSQYIWTRTTPVMYLGKQADMFHGVSSTGTLNLWFEIGTSILLGGNGTFVVMSMTVPIQITILAFDAKIKIPVTAFTVPGSCTNGTAITPPEPSAAWASSCYAQTHSSPHPAQSNPTTTSGVSVAFPVAVMLLLALLALF